jgi:hypothetical protein
MTLACGFHMLVMEMEERGAKSISKRLSILFQNVKTKILVKKISSNNVSK